MKGWLRIKEAPEYCGVSEGTLRMWIKDKGLKSSKVRGIVLINVADLDRFIEKYTVFDESQKIEEVVDDVIKSMA